MNPKPCPPCPTQPRRNRPAAFTLIELLVVLAMLAILATMLMPALAGARTNRLAFQCLNNLRQLQIGWLAYSTDFSDAICPTTRTGNSTAPNWVRGRMDFQAESTNTDLIQQGLLWPYVKSLPAYKCPADPKKHPSQVPTVRSVSINAWMNPAASWSSEGRVFRKQSDIGRAFSPSQCWVLIDENDQTINEGWFVVSANVMGVYQNTWIDVPASYHNKACGLSFADGHAEYRIWRDAYLLGPNVMLYMPADLSSGYADLRWLQARTTVPQ
jgi:prepilin-type N-terminal cleavage/methylation domain-containing protein/prepilin-type processing-associated H-X9-DG protein